MYGVGSIKIVIDLFNIMHHCKAQFELFRKEGSTSKFHEVCPPTGNCHCGGLRVYIADDTETVEQLHHVNTSLILPAKHYFHTHL